jgi:hypothetical protein
MATKAQAKTRAKSIAKAKPKAVRRALHTERFPGESKAYRAARNKLLTAEMALRAHVEQVAARVTPRASQRSSLRRREEPARSRSRKPAVHLEENGPVPRDKAQR